MTLPQPHYASDSEWGETDYKPFPDTEYDTFPYDPSRDPEYLGEMERFRALRRRNERYAHIGGTLVLLFVFTFPLILWGLWCLLLALISLIS